MPQLHELVTAPNIAGYWEESIEGRVPSLGLSLFPRRKQLGLELSFIKGKGGVPVVLKPAAFDTKAVLRDRIGVAEVKTDMPFFKEQMLIKEVDRQQLLQVMQTGNQDYINMVIGRIFDDKATLISGAEAQEERMRMQLLTQGKILITANGETLEYDYGMPKENIIKAKKLWSDPTATIGKDLLEQITEARKKGVVIRRLLMNSATLALMLENKAIQKELFGSSEGLVTPASIAGWLKTRLGLSVLVYDEVYKDEEGNVKQYVPDGVVTLLPDGVLGYTNFGTTPEEADLISGAEVSVALVNTGVAVSTKRTFDPVNIQTKVSMVNLPSFEQCDKIFIMTVAE